MCTLRSTAEVDYIGIRYARKKIRIWYCRQILNFHFVIRLIFTVVEFNCPGKHPYLCWHALNSRSSQPPSLKEEDPCYWHPALVEDGERWSLLPPPLSIFLAWWLGAFLPTNNDHYTHGGKLLLLWSSVPTRRPTRQTVNQTAVLT